MPLHETPGTNDCGYPAKRLSTAQRFNTKKACAIWALLASCTIFCVRVCADGFWFEELLSLQLSNQNSVIDTGVADGVNFVYEIAPFAEIGLGAQIQFGSQALYQTDFGFDSLFLTFRLPLQTALITFYPVGRIGYGFFIGNADYRESGTLPGGLYYALGAGCRTPDFTYVFLHRNWLFHISLEGTYESNAGLYSSSSTGSTANAVYSVWNIILGLGIQVMSSRHN